MAGEIRVQPGALQGAGQRLSGAGGEVSGVAGSVEAAGSAASATGDPAAGSAYARMCVIWTAELARLGESLSGLGRLTSVAGHIYEAMDLAVMPSGSGDGQ